MRAAYSGFSSGEVKDIARSVLALVNPALAILGRLGGSRTVSDFFGRVPDRFGRSEAVSELFRAAYPRRST